MNKRNLIVGGLSMAALAVLGTGCTTTGGASGDPAAQRQALNSQADNALTRLYREARDSEALVKQARGVLVFPNFVSAGFIVGGASGQGVLREGGKTVSYHRMSEGSVGLLAGAQSQAVFILFMTDDALGRFKTSNGWTVGADANVTLLTVGADASITGRTAQQPVVGFVLTNSGLMGSLSLSGSRITPLNLN
ncbi:MAG: YSC84-related protein [Burkholderiaceae bacterium]|jgi:lipid-binding SYLF domain-containing protein|nr:YSC84-related protein [Burkholderiaceae bacterium]